jgi:DNA-binding transcriptional LysR family regulator
MGLQQLRYFVAVAENESFRRASEKLHIAQPALSRQMAALESDLGVELFIRSKRRIALTHAGKAYLLDIRHILSQLEQANDRTRRIASGNLGIVRLGFHETAGRSPFVLRALGLFRTNFPEIEVSLSQMTSHQQVDAIQEGLLDAGFLYPSSVDPTGLEMTKVSTDLFFLAVSKQHRLAARKRLRVVDIVSERFVRVARAKSPRFYDLLTYALARRGVTLDVMQEADSESMLMNFVSINMAAAIVISPSAKSWHPDVNFISISDLDVALDLYFAWDAQRSAAPLSRFIECLTESLR